MKKLWNLFKSLFKKHPDVVVIPNKPVKVEELDDNYVPYKHKDHYTYLISSVRIKSDKIGIANWYRDRIVDNQDRYEYVERKTKVPWQVIAVIHAMEGALKFDTVLHNGESLEDVHKHGTRLVPRGLGKGLDWIWEDAAVDALAQKKRLQPDNWSNINTLYYIERYNGMGYRLYHSDVNTPYLWSNTNHYIRGKYIADGKWSSTTISKQCGCVPVLMQLGYFKNLDANPFCD